MVAVGRREGWWEYGGRRKRETDGRYKRDGGSREEGGMVAVGRREGWWE